MRETQLLAFKILDTKEIFKTCNIPLGYIRQVPVNSTIWLKKSDNQTSGFTYEL